MKARPILFGAATVRAILSGTKTQTRRVVKPQPADDLSWAGWCISSTHAADEGKATWARGYGLEEHRVRCPYGQPGDRLWVITLVPVAFGAGKYAVGDDGNLYDVSGSEPRRRKPAITEKGYEEISLRAAGERQNFRINRLVAEAFYGQAPTSLPVCRHLDGDRRNNRPENLDWGTAAQNTADANASGAWSGVANGGARLSAVEVQAIRESGEPQGVLADRYGVTQPTISKIKTGKRWRQEHPSPPPPNLPRWASRITLEVTDVRVERLQDITEADAIAEGCIAESVISGYDGSTIQEPAEIPDPSGIGTRGWDDAREWYADLWEDINGVGSWDANPWVWVVSFKRETLGSTGSGAK